MILVLERRQVKSKGDIARLRSLFQYLEANYSAACCILAFGCFLIVI